jgi:hypothetical protein
VTTGAEDVVKEALLRGHGRRRRRAPVGVRPATEGLGAAVARVPVSRRGVVVGRLAGEAAEEHGARWPTVHVPEVVGRQALVVAAAGVLVRRPLPRQHRAHRAPPRLVHPLSLWLNLRERALCVRMEVVIFMALQKLDAFVSSDFMCIYTSSYAACITVCRYRNGTNKY